MIENYERLAVLRLIQSQRQADAQTLKTAAWYAVQVVLSAGLLILGYRIAHAPAAVWAVVSAVLVIQPVLEQALAASLVRICANAVGGVVGIIVARLLGDGVWQILLAMVIVIFICERLRLDLGLRTACVSVAIIMMVRDGAVASTGVQRLVAVIVGCVLALLVQVAAECVRRLLGWKAAIAPAASAPARSQQK
jgi:uncharacterized membrane protein YgaE (UPF0421/DUF939 family)